MQAVLLARQSQDKDGKAIGRMGLYLNEAVSNSPLLSFAYNRITRLPLRINWLP